jgi:transcriptional regulator with XRE-family HTH domain
MSERNSPPPLAPPDLSSLGSRLVRLRVQRGWKQIELSHRTGIPPTRLSRLEKGRCAPRLEELIQLCVVLGADLDQIVFGGQTRTSPTQRLAGEVERLGAPEELDVIRRLLHCLITGLQAERISHVGR